MAEFVGGGGGGFDYVQDTAPSNPKAGESWLDTSQNPHVIKVYNGGSSSWDAVATATDLNNHAGTVDAHHTRYTDAEASSAAPVQSVEGKTGDVSISHGDLSNVGANDHHSRPTGTNSVSDQGGWSGEFTIGPGNSHTINEFVDALEITYAQDDPLQLNFADGSTDHVTSGTANFSAKVLESVTSEESAYDIKYRYHIVALPSHSHGI